MKSSRKYILLVGALVAVLLLVILALVVHYEVMSSPAPYSSVGKQKTDPVPGFLKRLAVSDGLDLGWYHYDGNWKQFEEALKGNTYQMFSTSVSISGRSDDNVVYVRPGYTTPVSFTKWLDAVMHYPRKGVQIVIQSQQEANLVYDEFKSRSNDIALPVWIKMDAVSESGRVKFAVNLTNVSGDLKTVLPSATLSLGWGPSSCCSKEMVKEIWKLCENLAHHINIAVTTDITEESWLNLRWLLEKSEEMSLTIADNTTAVDNIWFNLLTIRNDFVKSRIFYDIPTGPGLARFKSLSKTAGSPLNHFDVDFDAAKITWAHAVNSREKLDEALKDGIMFLEADILLRGQGTARQTNIPVMAHPPATDSNLTLQDWLDVAVQTNRGLKLDFKSIESFGPSLVLLNQRRAEISQPVWLNADILPWPDAPRVPVNATQFLGTLKEEFPEAILSLGWVTKWTNSPADGSYTKALMEEMHALCESIPQPITLPIRAAAAKKSWCNLQWFLDQSRRYTITIWTGSADNVSQEDMNYIRRHSEKSRVYFDLPPDLMPDV